MRPTRKHIIAVAIALIERDGVGALSLSRLATELGCDVVSLYDHVPSKSALLEAVAEAVASGMELPSMPEASWEIRLRAVAGAFCGLARTHPRCAVLAAATPGSARAKRSDEYVLAALHQAGLRGPDAVPIMRAFLAYLTGWLVCQAGPPGSPADPRPTGRPSLRHREFPPVTCPAGELHPTDPDADFEFGLDLLVDAIAARCPAPTGRMLP